MVENMTYKIETLYNILEQLIKDINPNLVVKFSIEDPESSPAILFDVPSIQRSEMPQLSEVWNNIRIPTVMLVKGNQPAIILTNMYEDFIEAFYSELYNLLQLGGVECDYMELGRFQPQNELFGTSTYKVLGGELSFNIKM